jgi:hypothetical protein
MASRVRQWDVHDERLPEAARPKPAAMREGGTPGTAGAVSLLQLQRLIGNRAVVDAVSSGALVDGWEQDARPADGPRPAGASRRGTDAAKYLRPAAGNPKVDRLDPALLAETKAELKAEEEQEQRQSLPSGSGSKRKSRRQRDIEAMKRKGSANTNWRGGLSPARAVYAVKAAVTTLPDVAVNRMEPSGPNGVAGLDPTDFGFCETEDIGDADIKVKAVRDGNEWHAEVTKISAKYSLLTQLPPGVAEITGPGGGGAGETTLANSKEQIRSLLATEGDNYYMVKSVKAHEEVHETRLLPALRSVAPQIQADFSAITVPYAGKGNPSTATTFATAAEALTAIKATPAYAATVAGLRNLWDAEYVNRIGGDHGGTTQRAEIGASTPMILKINAYRMLKGKSPLAWRETWVPY